MLVVRMMSWTIWFPLFAAALLVVTGCEENPVGGDEGISVANRQITGTVRFDTNIEPANVYVWLDGFDLNTRTDRTGKFELVLPPSAAQGRSGITGAFNLYYYMGNYTFASTEVFTKDGEFVYDTEEISADGQLREAVLLFQRLRIRTAVRPGSVSRSAITVTGGKSDFVMAVDVTLQAARNDTVIVFFPATVESRTGPLLFRNTVTDQVTVLNSIVAEQVTSALDTVTAAQKVRTMEINLFPDDLGVGEYEIIPYLLVDDVELPAGLRDELGLDVLLPGAPYLKIPFVRDGDQRVFTVDE